MCGSQKRLDPTNTTSYYTITAREILISNYELIYRKRHYSFLKMNYVYEDADKPEKATELIIAQILQKSMRHSKVLDTGRVT